VGQWQRDVNTGLRSLLPTGIDPPGRDISELTGVSWPGGRERYQHAHHPLNEASAWPALGSDRMDNSFAGKWGMTGGPNLYSGSYPMYPTWTGGMGVTGAQGYGRDNYNPLQYKWGYPTDMLEVENRSAVAEQSENFPLGEFSGMEFPPRPLDYDADEFVGTPVERYQPAPGTEYNPMENIEYDDLHMMNPSDAEEFQTSSPEMMDNDMMDEIELAKIYQSGDPGMINKGSKWNFMPGGDPLWDEVSPQGEAINTVLEMPIIQQMITEGGFNYEDFMRVIPESLRRELPRDAFQSKSDFMKQQPITVI